MSSHHVAFSGGRQKRQKITGARVAAAKRPCVANPAESDAPGIHFSVQLRRCRERARRGDSGVRVGVRGHAAMKRYSVFAVAREAARYHTGWERAWRNPAPVSANLA